MSEPLVIGDATLHVGDCIEVLRTVPDESVQTCVTSPPYYGLRDYGVEQQMGLEKTPEEYVARLVEVFREVRRVLRDDGTVWLNLGDSYVGSGRGGNPESGAKQGTNKGSQSVGVVYGRENESATAERVRLREQLVALKSSGLKPKDLVGIPWRVAFALQADGWYLRQDIVWAKPNPMPESVLDRCTKAHEYIFHLSKSRRYYFDAEAIAEPIASATIERMSQPNLENQKGSLRSPLRGERPMKAVTRRSGNKARKSAAARGVPGVDPSTASGAVAGSVPWEGSTRNKRSVWTVATKPFKGAHFAMFPPALIEPCILAGAPKGGVVLDPFGGSGTTAEVALRHGRKAILIDLNPDYQALQIERVNDALRQPRLFD